VLHLKAIPDVILSNTSLSIKPRWPIKEAIKIVRRISSATTDMHNAQYVEQKQPKNCYNNHSKNNIRAKNSMNHNTNLQWVLHNLGILPATNKPLIPHSNARLDNASITLSQITVNLANRQQ